MTLGSVPEAAVLVDGERVLVAAEHPLDRRRLNHGAEVVLAFGVRHVPRRDVLRRRFLLSQPSVYIRILPSPPSVCIRLPPTTPSVYIRLPLTTPSVYWTPAHSHSTRRCSFSASPIQSRANVCPLERQLVAQIKAIEDDLLPLRGFTSSAHRHHRVAVHKRTRLVLQSGHSCQLGSTATSFKSTSSLSSPKSPTTDSTFEQIRHVRDS